MSHSKLINPPPHTCVVNKIRKSNSWDTFSHTQIHALFMCQIFIGFQNFNLYLVCEFECENERVLSITQKDKKGILSNDGG